MKNVFSIIVILVLAFSMSACYGTSKAKVMGKWDCNGKQVEFKSNGDIKSDGTFAPGATYKIDGDKMTISEAITGDMELTIEAQDDGSVNLKKGDNVSYILKKEAEKEKE